MKRRASRPTTFPPPRFDAKTWMLTTGQSFMARAAAVRHRQFGVSTPLHEIALPEIGKNYQPGAHE